MKINAETLAAITEAMANPGVDAIEIVLPEGAVATTQAIGLSPVLADPNGNLWASCENRLVRIGEWKGKLRG